MTEDGTPPEAAPAEPTQPALRIVEPHATPEEVAAIVAVFRALHSAYTAEPAGTPEWSAHHRKVRRTLPHGPGGWRSSALPR